MSLLFKFIIHFYREHQLIIILSKAKKNTSISILFRQFDTVVNQKCKFLNESYSRSLKCKGEVINPARPTIWLHMLCRQYTVWKKLLRSSFNFLNVVFTSLYLIKPTFYIIKKNTFALPTFLHPKKNYYRLQSMYYHHMVVRVIPSPLYSILLGVTRTGQVIPSLLYSILLGVTREGQVIPSLLYSILPGVTRNYMVSFFNISERHCMCCFVIKGNWKSNFKWPSMQILP